MMTKEELLQKQVEIEKDSIRFGVERYRKGVASVGEADSIPGMKLMKAALPALVAAIDEWKADCSKGHAKGMGIVHFANQFETDMLAYVTLKMAINGAASRLTFTNMAFTLTKVLEDQLNYDKLKVEDPKLFRKWSDKVKKSKSDSHKVFFLKRQLKYAGLVEVKWEMRERARFGAIMLQLLLDCCDLFDKEAGSRKDAPKMMLTAQAEKFLQEAHARSEILFPINVPMVVRPKPWTNPFDGGYLTIRHNLVKSNNKAYLDELKVWDMPAVYNAVNALQDTKWAINNGILRLMKEVWDAGGYLGGLPKRDPLPLPKYPENYNDLTEDEQRNISRAYNQVKEENFRMMSKRITMINRLAMAEQFAEYEAIYFPHSLDWRGRVYPMSGYLHPQADDSGKALLQFAEGKPLGETGAYWLAVHLANTFGVDKVSFEERVKWVEDNSDMILECAMNPLDGSREWAKADSPWMFLAACMEWMGYAMQGESYVSHIPVSWDGSCNGLQNFSAMLRDEKGGRATNLVPQDKPADVYGEVAKAASVIIDVDTSAGNEMAALWQDKVTRKWAKRNTMTMPYGSGKYGFRTQLEEELRKFWYEQGERYLSGGDDFHASLYLADVMYTAISNTVVAARQAMDWLQATARVAAKEGKPIHWTTPAGFLVVQDYKVELGERIDFNLLDKRITLTVVKEGDALDTRKQAQGISPNFVHSMDASHMMLTVNACLDEGVTAFAMIHDSYGTHAADAETLSRVLREQFVHQYQTNVLEEFREEVLTILPEEKHGDVPPVPPMGTLDLEAVLDSEYFFA